MRDEKWVGRRHVDPYVTAAWLFICALGVLFAVGVATVLILLAGAVS